jgi:hypothetical protein
MPQRRGEVNTGPVDQIVIRTSWLNVFVGRTTLPQPRSPLHRTPQIGRESADCNDGLSCSAAGGVLARKVTTGGLLMNVEKVAERIRAEFDEMPGLVLTMPQASRFFGLDQELTRSVIERLVGSAYLRKTRDGAVARTTR